LSPPAAPLDELEHDARERLGAVVGLLAADPSAPSSVRDPDDAWRVHVADSLCGLQVDSLRRAERIADVGAGAGFPGIVLAAALPASRADLIESVGRKCEFMRRALDASGIANAHVVCGRAEAWAESLPPDGGRESYDAVVSRAVGRLATVAELASPLLRLDGTLVVWKGRRDPEEDAELSRAVARLAMKPERVLAVGPFAGSRHRHLHVLRKSGPTPEGLPRRPGMAKKRPFGAA
jgi:16S rRNA (guanine527-N7)-methyltransferase